MTTKKKSDGDMGQVEHPGGTQAEPVAAANAARASGERFRTVYENACKSLPADHIVLILRPNKPVVAQAFPTQSQARDAVLLKADHDKTYTLAELHIMVSDQAKVPFKTAEANSAGAAIKALSA